MKPSDPVPSQVCRLLIAAVAAAPVYLGMRHGLFNLDHNPVLESALAGAFLIHMWTRPRAAEWAPVLSIGGAFTAAYAWLHHGFGNHLAAGPSALAAFLGVGSIMVLGVQSVLADPSERTVKRCTLFAAAIFPYFSFLLAICLNLTTAFQPKVYDLSLYAFDESLSIGSSSAIGHLMNRLFLLRVAGVLVYQAMPLAICFLLARERVGRPFPVSIMRLFITVGLTGAALYNLLPAAGPVYAFGRQFPDHLPAIATLALRPVLLATAPRNAMPSVHFACALLIWWNMASLERLWRSAAAIFVAITFLATIGFGEHYLVDLVVAVPFAVAMQGACLRAASWQSWRRRMACGGGGALTMVWIAALRAGWQPGSPAIAWLCVVVTLVLSLWWKRGIGSRHSDLEQQILPVRAVILPQEP